MDSSLQHTVLTGIPESHISALTQALRGQGVVLRAVAAHDAQEGDALLSLMQVDDQAVAVVRQLAAGGRRRVLAVCAHGSEPAPADQWRLLRAGASDVVAGGDARHYAAAVVARLARWREVDDLLQSPLVCNHLIGESAIWRQTLRRVIEIARHGEASVLIGGESGTGKELVARLIHTLDARPRKRNLVTLDCTTFVPELIGSELFGHERGAFTGAIAPRDGACSLADGGTLFLDEIGELPLTLQPQLLRVLQERQYKRVGGNHWHATDFRLICASHRPLAPGEGDSRFRPDLYYRIAGAIVVLPPLRDRPQDVLPLAEHFARQCVSGNNAIEIGLAVREYLLQRPYPGNVRELRQVVTALCARHVGPGPLTLGDIPPEVWPQTAEDAAVDWRDGSEFEHAIDRALLLGARLKDVSQFATETAIRLTISREGGSLQRAANRLGLTDRALQMRRAQHRQRHTR